MALSGTIYSSNFGSNSFRLKLNWSATQNITNNTSTISTNLYFESLQSWAKFNDGTNSPWNIAIDGQNTSGTANSTIAGNQSKWIASATKTVTHASDGSKSLAIGANHTIDISYSGSTIGTPRLDGRITLNPIARTSSVSLVGAKTAEMGKHKGLFIKIDRKNGAFTHDLKYSFGKKNGVIANKINYVDFEWTIPADFATETTNSVTGWGTIICDTYNGATKIGSSSVRFDTTVPNNASYNPTISVPSIVDTNAAVNTAVGAYNIQRLSKMKISSVGATKYGATISSITFLVKATNHGGTISGTTGTAYSTPSDSGAHPVVATIRDSRGRTSTASSSFTITPYVAPGITSFTANRRGLSSTTIDVNATGRMSAVGAVNIATMKVSTSPVNSPTWTLQKTLTSSSGLGLSTGVLPVLNISITDSYEVKIEIYDKLTPTPSVQIISVGTAIFPMSWGKTGIGVGTVFNPTGSALQVVGGIEADRYVSNSLPSNINLNNITAEGFHYARTNAVAGTLGNCPTPSAFSLFVEQHAGVKQTLTEFVAKPKTWIRNSYNGVWSPWQLVSYDTGWIDVPLLSGFTGFVKVRQVVNTVYFLGSFKGKSSEGNNFPILILPSTVDKPLQSIDFEASTALGASKGWSVDSAGCYLNASNGYLYLGRAIASATTYNLSTISYTTN